MSIYYENSTMKTLLCAIHKDIVLVINRGQDRKFQMSIEVIDRGIKLSLEDVPIDALKQLTEELPVFIGEGKSL